MKIDHLNVTAARVRPRLGWGNSPDLVLQVDGPMHPGDIIYNYDEKEGIYWHQGDGYTDFLYAGPPYKENNRYRTKNGGGYSGRTFTLTVALGDDFYPVDVVGPWSGGCYCANKVLPKPALEAVANNCSIYLTWESIQGILEEFHLLDWSIGDDGFLTPTSPCLFYKGVPKRNWTPEIKQELIRLNLDEYDPKTLARLGF